MLQTMLFLGYVLAAGVVYTTIEGWNYLNSVYYVVSTFHAISLCADHYH